LLALLVFYKCWVNERAGGRNINERASDGDARGV